MKFTIIKDSDCQTRAMNGYRFVDPHKTEVDKSVNPEWDENRWEKEIDSFYDGWESVCKGDDGRCYLVAFDVETERPMIWTEIEIAEQ